MSGIKTYDELEPEHRLQVELLDALLVAVQGGRDDEQVDELLQRLRDISEAHFLSEDLLMRLHAYPEHADHVGEHEVLTRMLDDMRRGEHAPDVVRLSALRNRYVNHIHEKDARLEAFLKAPGRNDDLNSPQV